MSLRIRIILGYFFLLAGSFIFVIILISQDIRPRYLEAIEEATIDTAEILAALLAEEIEDETLPLAKIDRAMQSLKTRQLSAKIYDSLKTSVGTEIYITDAKGALLYDSSGRNAPGADFSRWRDVYLTLKGAYGARSTRIDPKDSTSSVIYIAAPIMKNGRIAGVVTAGKSQDSVSLFISIAKKKFLSALLFAAVTASLLGVLISFWITWPLRRLLDYVRSVRSGGGERPPRLGSSEIGLLGKAVGEMQSQLEGKNYIEDYVRALTHEMKSPLTGIKGAAEILRDEASGASAEKFLNNIDSDVERLQSLIERTLQLSRLENVRTVNTTTIQLEPFLQSIAENFLPHSRKKGLTIAVSAADLAFEADEFLLRQAVGNLISNAMDFAPPGSLISLTGAPDKHGVEITVKDRGTGIPDFALPKVFDKFFSLPRPDSGKKSSGLGLPFVREVITLHNGEISLGNACPGLEVRLWLPVKQV